MAGDAGPGDLFSFFWAPLCAVGAHDGEQLNAQICVSVFGASIVPSQPRLLVGLSKTNYTHDLVERNGCGGPKPHPPPSTQRGSGPHVCRARKFIAPGEDEPSTDGCDVCVA